MKATPFSRRYRYRRLSNRLRRYGPVALLLATAIGLVLSDTRSLMDKLADLPNVTYYPNCDAARAAGVAPIYRGEPGYRPQLDADNDGIACEPWRGRR